MGVPTDNAEDLGLAIKRARLNAGLTQKALAQRLATSNKRVGRWEAGDTSSLGETPEAQFAVAAQVAAATGDLTLIGVTDPENESELLSLRRDVAQLQRQVRRLAELLVERHLLPRPELPQLLEEVASSGAPPARTPGVGGGRSRG